MKPELPSSSEMLTEVESTLGLSTREAAQMLRVSGSTIRRWRAGIQPSERNLSWLGASHLGVRILTGMIRQERIAETIRRPAPAYGGRRALDLILDGRLGEVNYIVHRTTNFAVAILHHPEVISQKVD